MTYQGLPPMLADSVPDRFGNRIIDSVSRAKVCCPARSVRSITSFDAITRADLHAVGDAFGIRGYRRIIREVEAAVANWSEFAAKARLPEDLAQRRIRPAASLGVRSVDA